MLFVDGEVALSNVNGMYALGGKLSSMMKSSNGGKQYLIVYDPMLLFYSITWMCYGWEEMLVDVRDAVWPWPRSVPHIT